MIVLGIETSCDETAAGIVCDNEDVEQRILASAIASQMTEHKPYGGVVPEIAARAHLDKLDNLIIEVLRQADFSLDDIDGIAATCGPGLIGGVMIGSMMGKAISAARNLPFFAVNHLEAHALTARLTHDVKFPYLLLLVSGGHTQLVLVKGIGIYRLLGTTVDDAVGECFDKSAKLLGFDYPGGPAIEKAASKGNPERFKLPKPMLKQEGCDFSFAGLKTSVRRIVQTSLDESVKADIAASLQAAIVDILIDRSRNAFNLLAREGENISAFVIAGGVAANQALRAGLASITEENNIQFIAPPSMLCTDNGVMVAWAGLERLKLGLFDNLTVPARPRWPLEEIHGQ